MIKIENTLTPSKEMMQAVIRGMRHRFLLQHSAYADVLEKTHSKETEWAKHHKPYEKSTPIKRKFTAKLKDK